MPFASSNGSTSEENVSENSDDGSDDDDDESEWLESVGIDKGILPKKESLTQPARQSQQDQSSRSLVLVQGAQTLGLYNFLLNSKSVIACTGPLTGVPPTLLAPVAFEGGTLKSMKVNQSVLKVAGGTKQVHLTYN